MRGSWRPNKDCNILTPQLIWLSQPFFPILLGCSTEGLGGQPLLGHGSHSSIFSPTVLNFLSPGLYNNLTPTYFLRASQFCTQFNPSTVKVTPDIFDWMHLLFTQVHFFFWELGRVGGQYATLQLAGTVEIPRVLIAKIIQYLMPPFIFYHLSISFHSLLYF